MGILANYQEWRDAKELDYALNDSYVECPECDGDGCDKCGYTGGDKYSEIWFDAFPVKKYKNEVFSDLKELCLWTGSDFLIEAGIFINQMNKDRGLNQ
jgi:hypothetical protein